MTDCTEYLSEEYICGKVDARDAGERTNPKINDCKIEDLGEVSSLSGSGFEVEEKVGKFDVESFKF